MNIFSSIWQLYILIVLISKTINYTFYPFLEGEFKNAQYIKLWMQVCCEYSIVNPSVGNKNRFKKLFVASLNYPIFP